MNEKTEEFIRKAREKHGNTYDYSKTVYVKSKQKVIIICKEHGEFLQTPNAHISQHQGCIKCGYAKNSESQRDTMVSIIRKFYDKHGRLYDYSMLNNTVYINNETKLPIICKEHGIFYQSSNSHLRGSGCKKCSIIKVTNMSKLQLDEFISKSNKIHHNKYSYQKTKYTKLKDKICIICPKHGEFWQEAMSHVRGVGCPTCRESTGEKKICEFLNNNRIKYVRQHKFHGCVGLKNKLPFDFFLPETNTVIEFDGLQHFEGWNNNKLSLLLIRQTDELKTKYCNDNNIGLIRIRYDEIDKIDEILTECITHGIRYRGLPIENLLGVANI